MKSIKLVLASSLLFLTACPSIGQLLQTYGYTELRPPSTFFAPGTMVWVQNKKPFTAGIICTQQASLGPAFTPMVSPTEDATFTKASRQAFELDANYMDIVHADIQFEAVQSITAQMSNPLVYVLSDVDIIDNINRRDPVCTQAIEGRRTAGYKVTMISQALMGDVVYTVQYKSDFKIDAAAKLAMIQNLALALKIENATLTEDTISGNGLFWGVKDDTYLAAMGDPNTQAVPDDGNTTRLIPADVIPSLDYDADAP